MSDERSRGGARPGALRGTALSRAVLGAALLLGALPIGGPLMAAVRGDDDPVAGPGGVGPGGVGSDGVVPNGVVAGGVGPAGEWSTAGCAMPRSSHGGTPASLSAAMQRIEQDGRARFPRHYAGLEVDERQVRAIVYRVPSAAFDTFVRTSAEDSCVVVRDAAHSRADLDEWQHRIVADLDRWTTEGVRISTVGARHDGAGVEIGTEDVAGARRALTAHYGAQAPLVFVEQGPVTPLQAAVGQTEAGPRPAAQPGG
jgi:hypothetical protein